MTVAAVNQVSNYTSPASEQMSAFSNYGPTDDGRIKPDISAKGVAVNSCTAITDASYTSLQGTSMSAPAITGLIALLQKHYNNLNPTTFMKSASVRGLLCHSAREAGYEVGPDYEFGWGLADGLSAAQVISSKGTTGVFDERNLANGETFTTSFTINSAQDINVTICWTDPAGSANVSSNNDDRSPRLRNNLDLKVLKDGNIGSAMISSLFHYQFIKENISKASDLEGNVEFLNKKRSFHTFSPCTIKELKNNLKSHQIDCRI